MPVGTKPGNERGRRRDAGPQQLQQHCRRRLIGAGNVTSARRTLACRQQRQPSPAPSAAPAAFTIAGGTQTFSGCNNTYTGVTTHQGARLSVDCLPMAAGQRHRRLEQRFGQSGVQQRRAELHRRHVTTDRGFTLARHRHHRRDQRRTTTLSFSGQVVGGDELAKDGAGTLVLVRHQYLHRRHHVRGGILRAGSTRPSAPRPCA